MQIWVPVISTLIGVALGGLVSFLTTRLAAQQQTRRLQLELSERRAIWATERRLAGITQFYETIARLHQATGDYRVTNARLRLKKEREIELPSWVKPYNEARAAFEDALSNAWSEALLLESDIEAEFRKALEPNRKRELVETEEEGIELLWQFEFALSALRRRLAQRYRKVFLGRVKGKDLESLAESSFLPGDENLEEEEK